MNADTLYSAVQELVVLGSGLPKTHVIAAYDSGVTPNESFATLHLSADHAIGYSEQRVSADRADETYQYRRASYQIAFYRRSAMTRAQRLLWWIFTDNCRFESAQRQITLQKPSPLTNLPEPETSEYESRVMLELDVDYWYIDSQPLIDVETVEIEVHTDDLAAEFIEVENESR